MPFSCGCVRRRINRFVSFSAKIGRTSIRGHSWLR